jgi:hypothetical protein
MGKDENGADKLKGEYVKIGVILSGDNGEYALLDPTVNIAGCLMKQRVMNQGKEKKGKGDMVMCSIFTDEPKQQSQGGQSPVFDSFDDDVVF